MKLPRPILNEFRRNKIKLDKDGFAETPDFRIRLYELTIDPKYLEPGEKRWVIQFAYKPTFDRWANSTNFETEIWYSPKKNRRYWSGKRRPQYTVPKLDKELEWCSKCAESGVFNFHTYFNTIKTPWFIH